jgi:hypothetical protein
MSFAVMMGSRLNLRRLALFAEVVVSFGNREMSLGRWQEGAPVGINQTNPQDYKNDLVQTGDLKLKSFFTRRGIPFALNKGM